MKNFFWSILESWSFWERNERIFNEFTGRNENFGRKREREGRSLNEIFELRENFKIKRAILPIRKFPFKDLSSLSLSPKIFITLIKFNFLPFLSQKSPKRNFPLNFTKNRENRHQLSQSPGKQQSKQKKIRKRFCDSNGTSQTTKKTTMFARVLSLGPNYKYIFYIVFKIKNI